jgi:hypothetical protein
MKRLLSAACGLSMLVNLSMLASPARASTSGSFEFLFNSDRATSDNQYFLHLTVGSYDYPRTVIEPVVPRLRYVDDDLPVVLFLAHESGRPVDTIVDLRARGFSWSVIFGRVGVSYDVLFEGFDGDPGPPYGRAWGYWRSHHHSRRARFSDADICGLVAVQTGHRLTGVPVMDVCRARGRGEKVAFYVADRKGRHHHGGPGSDEDRGGRGDERSGHDEGHDRGHGEGHGKGEGHGHGR